MQPACSQPAIYPSRYLLELPGAGAYGNSSIQNFSPRKQPSVQSVPWLLSSHQTCGVETSSSGDKVALAAGVIDSIEASVSEQTAVAINRLFALTFKSVSYTLNIYISYLRCIEIFSGIYFLCVLLYFSYLTLFDSIQSNLTNSWFIYSSTRFILLSKALMVGSLVSI